MGCSSFKCPLVFPSNFLFFLRCEIILDVEVCPDFFRRLALDESRHFLAAEIQKLSHVQIVCCHDQLVQHGLINVNEVLLPCIEIIIQLALMEILCDVLNILLVMYKPFAEVKHERKRPPVYVWQRHCMQTVNQWLLW